MGYGGGRNPRRPGGKRHNAASGQNGGNIGSSCGWGIRIHRGAAHSGLAQDILETDDYGYLVTDQNMCTRIAGVYAAGDARRTPLRQIVTAAADGAIAAYSASIYLAEESQA